MQRKQNNKFVLKTKMAKLLLTYFIVFVTVIGAKAENTRFTMSAPNAVEMGKQFRLSFSINERGTNLQLPPGLTTNFDVLMGPSTGSSTRTQIINGRSTTDVSYSYTYILRAKAEGSCKIRPA